MIRSPRTLSTITWAVLLGGFVSCASYTDQTREMREAFVAGDYDRALESLKRSGIKDRSQDRLLWRLEEATILDRKGEYEKSRKLWLEADEVADDLYTVSVSKTATSFVMSDASADYAGEDYEKVAIHSLLAHQFIGLGQMNEARIEARKINNKLVEINQKYDAENKNKYSEDAHARYLTALIYEARGEWDNAIIDYSKALELYEGRFSGYISGPVPRGVVTGLHRVLRLRDRSDRLKALSAKYDSVLKEYSTGSSASLEQMGGEVVVIHELGQVAPKVAEEFMLGVGDQIVRFSFPALRPRAIHDMGTGVQVQGLGFFKGENTAYMDAIAHDTLENRRTRMMAKQMSRLLLKGQINYQAEKNFGPLAGLLANIVTASTETADTRSWSTLPQAFFVTRARLAPGTYDIAIKTNGRVGAVKRMAIKKGEMQILRGLGQ